MNSTLSLGGNGVHSGRGLVTPRPEPSPRRNKTRHQHFECHHSLLLHIYTIKRHGWMQRLGFFFSFLNFALLGHRGSIDTEFVFFSFFFLKKKHKPYIAFFWPVSMSLDHNTVYQSSQDERPVIQQKACFDSGLVFGSFQPRPSFDHQHLTLALTSPP